MTVWPSDAYAEASPTVAAACLELLTNEPLWVHRRVETVDILRRELARRQVTVEFTLPSDLRDRLRISEDGPWCVPLALLKKEPLRHFDLREDGAAIPVLGREPNGQIASEVLRATAAMTGLGMISTRLAKDLDAIATDPADAAFATLQRFVARPLRDAETATVLDDDRAQFFVATLAESYILIALLKDPSGRRILKYSYDDSLEFAFGGLAWSRRLSQRLGWEPMLVDVPVPVAARGPSYHAEVVVPEELRVDAFIFDGSTGERLSTKVERSVDRAALHVPMANPWAEPILLTAIYAERSGTPSVAVTTALVTTAALGIGIGFGNLDGPTAGSSTAVVLAGSALFAGIVARGGEHRLVRDAFSGSRVMLAIVGLSALAAAASVAFGANPCVRTWVWSAGTVVSSLATASLAIAWKMSKSLRRRQVPST